MEILSAIGLLVLIILGVLIITLLAYAIRILLMIYAFFGTKGKESELEGKGSMLGRVIKSAGVIEIILFLLKSRGRFKR